MLRGVVESPAASLVKLSQIVNLAKPLNVWHIPKGNPVSILNNTSVWLSTKALTFCAASAAAARKGEEIEIEKSAGEVMEPATGHGFDPAPGGCLVVGEDIPH